MRWLPLLLLLGGCAEYYAGDAAFKKEAELISDEVLKQNMFMLCHALPVGTILFWFGQDPEKWQAYGKVCAVSFPAVPGQ